MLEMKNRNWITLFVLFLSSNVTQFSELGTYVRVVKILAIDDMIVLGTMLSLAR